MTLLVGSIFHMTRKIVSEMTYNVSMGTLNPTIPYPAKFYLDRFRGGGYGPQNWKKWNFTNIIAPKRRIPCTIFFTKFTGFMRVLSLHNFAKFRCFVSINGKIINNLPRWGCFQPNFRRPLAAKLWTGPKNVLDLKWWHRHWDQLYHHAKFRGNRATHVGVRGQSVMFFCLFFVYNAPEINVAADLVALLQQEIALVIVGRFRCGLQRFSGKKSPFQRMKQIWKLSLGSATNGAPMRGKIYKIWKKWVQSLCAPLRPFRSELKENFFQNILSHVL